MACRHVMSMTRSGEGRSDGTMTAGGEIAAGGQMESHGRELRNDYKVTWVQCRNGRDMKDLVRKGGNHEKRG